MSVLLKRYNNGTFGNSGPSNLNHSAPAIERAIAVIIFAALLAGPIALNAFRIGGIPIRGIATIGVLALTIVFYFDVAKKVFEQNLLLLGLAAGFAALGIFVSLVNGADIFDILRAVTEVQVQAAATIIVASILAQVAGGRACAIAIILVIGASACVAAAQMLGIEPAWALRRALGPLSSEEVEGLNLVDRRPSGLAYSPIQFSTHLCLAFAAFVAVREKLRGFTHDADPLVLPALGVLFVGSLICATRSPILGGLIFLAAYALQRRSSWLPLFLIMGAVVAYFVWPLLMGVIENTAPRVVETDDNSSNARSTLAYYGLRLFADHPIGYGLTFAPMTLWHNYWPDLYVMQAPRGVREKDLHNYVVTMMNIYGIGMLLLTPLIVKLLKNSKKYLIFFIPYVVHIFFHNSGPFYNDNVIWFVIAAIAATHQPQVQRSSETGRLVSGVT